MRNLREHVLILKLNDTAELHDHNVYTVGGQIITHTPKLYITKRMKFYFDVVYWCVKLLSVQMF